MLTIENLSVNHGRIAALRGISLEVNRGELVGVVGPNGAGKSTLLLTVAGALTPRAGKIMFEDNEIVGRSPESLVRSGIALVPERRHIFTRLTVEENLAVGAATRSDARALDDELEDIFQRFPILKERLRVSASTLSGGEQQQLAIARSLLARPKLLLIDEPSLGLAPLMVERIFEVIEGLRAEGVTILLVEQLAFRTIKMSDRVYVLKGGEIVLSGASDDFDAEKIDISALYLR